MAKPLTKAEREQMRDTWSKIVAPIGGLAEFPELSLDKLLQSMYPPPIIASERLPEQHSVVLAFGPIGDHPPRWYITKFWSDLAESKEYDSCWETAAYWLPLPPIPAAFATAPKSLERDE